MNDKSRAIVLNLCVKRTLVLTLFVYLLAACFCDHLSLPQMDSISFDSATAHPLLMPWKHEGREIENVAKYFRDWESASDDGYAPGCERQNDYGFGPCGHIR
jgi:hypothetical protein